MGYGRVESRTDTMLGDLELGMPVSKTRDPGSSPGGPARIYPVIRKIPFSQPPDPPIFYIGKGAWDEGK